MMLSCSPERRAAQVRTANLRSSYTLCRLSTMGKKDTKVRMSLQTLRVLEAFLENPTVQLAGADVHQRCGIASGTLYPILLRLESAGWFVSQWESVDPSSAGTSAAPAVSADFNRPETCQRSLRKLQPRATRMSRRDDRALHSGPEGVIHWLRHRNAIPHLGSSCRAFLGTRHDVLASEWMDYAKGSSSSGIEPAMGFLISLASQASSGRRSRPRNASTGVAASDSISKATPRCPTGWSNVGTVSGA